MQAFPKTPEQKFILIAGTFLVLVAGLFMFDPGRSIESTTFVDAIPPEEFLTTAADAKESDRRPSNAPLSATEILTSGKKYDELNRQERRALYNAVMYFCNEEPDDKNCKEYVGYCGKSCQLLVQEVSLVR